MNEIIEGTAVELVPEVRAVAVVQQPGQALVAADTANGPEDMLARATKIATALARMVEAQRLYTTIQDKKYPHVEAWMTIARMDNVVAREARPPIKNDDGSWEAFAELVRLSDGMVIGASSAMCGAPKDGAWTSRGDHMKRSMAQTRAISRACRAQYSWIMALAGYQPTPADEMPDEPAGGTQPGTDPRSTPPPVTADTPINSGIVGKAIVKPDKRSQDFELRQTPDGMALGFRLEYDGRGVIVECVGPLADQVAFFRESVLAEPITVYGPRTTRSFDTRVKGTDVPRTVEYEVLAAERITVPGIGDLPAVPTEAPTVPMFDGSEKVNDLDNLPW